MGIFSSIKRGFQKIVHKAKVVAAEALLWMADKAEAFVGSVKNLWTRVRDTVAKIFLPMRRIIGFLFPDTLIDALLGIVGFVVDWATILENTALGKKVEAAIHWVIAAARRLADSILSKVDYASAKAHHEVLNRIIPLVRSPERRRALELTRLITTLLLLQSDLRNRIDSLNIDSFEDYLRLRATQKLVKLTKARMDTLTGIDQVSDDDLFVVEAGGKLISPEPELTDEEMKRLDEIIQSRHGKNLLAFVFEEMVVAWQMNLDKLEENYGSAQASLSKEKINLRRLRLKEQLGELTAKDKLLLAALQTRVSEQQTAQDALLKEILEMKNYIHASEGLVQMLESNEEVEDEQRSHITSEAMRVGKIIIECAQNGRKWETLTEEEQELITDYANIYAEASKNRVKQLVTVEVRG